MILLFAYWIYLFFVFAATGGLAIRLIEHFNPNRKNVVIPLNVLVWLGVASITTICGIYNLFFPISSVFHITVVLVLLLWMIFDRKACLTIYSSSMFHWVVESPCWKGIGRYSCISIRIICMLVFMSLVSLYTSSFLSGYPTAYDTDLYHAQSVQWAKEYPAVPGVGNIHLRLAFNNASFLTAAFYDIFGLKNKSYHVFNSFLFLIVVSMLFYRLVNLLLGNIGLTNVFSAILLHYLIRYTQTVNSLSPDVTVTLLTATLAVLFLDILEKKKLKLLLYGFILVCLGITVKLTLIPFLLLPILTGFHLLINSEEEKLGSNTWNKRTIFVYTVCCILIIFPWLVRGFITSGYLLWAFPAIDFPNIDWKVPESYVSNEIAWIRSWAWAPGTSPQEFAAKDHCYWMLKWVKTHQHLVHTVGLLVVVNIVIGALFRNRYKNLLNKSWPFCIALILALLFWFTNAPATRFGAGYLFCLKGILLALPLCLFKGIGQKFLHISVALVILYGSMHQISQHLPKLRQMTQPLQKYRNFPITQYMFPSGLVVNLTVAPEDRCGNAEIPCMPFYYKKFNIGMRGNELKKGLRRIQP